MAWTKTSEALTKLPELLLQGKLHFNFDGLPLIADQLSLKKRVNLIKVGLDQMLRSNWSHGLPPIIQIEMTNICNLKCPLCPTGSGSLPRPKGFMSMETFQRIIDDLDDALIVVYLFCFGEPFLNKEMTKMIELCTSRNILTLTSTNGSSFISFGDALKIVDAGLTTLIIAIDGSTQEIYESYRKGGNLEKIKRFINIIEEAKIYRKSSFPYTCIRSVVTSNNMQDLPNIEKLALDLGVNMFSYKSLGCLVNTDDYKDYEPLENSMKRFSYSGSSNQNDKLTECLFPFRQPIVFWDGTVVGCEYDHDLEMAFGKIGEMSFRDIWNTPQAVRLRESIRKNHGKPAFCRRCPYEGRSKDGTSLFCKEFRSL